MRPVSAFRGGPLGLQAGGALCGEGCFSSLKPGVAVSQEVSLTGEPSGWFRMNQAGRGCSPLAPWGLVRKALASLG